MEKHSAAATYQMLIDDLKSTLGLDSLCMDAKYKDEAKKLIGSIMGRHNIRSQQERANSLIYRINEKLELNSKRVKDFIDSAAKLKVYFNYHEKKFLRQAYDKNDRTLLESVISERFAEAHHYDSIISLFAPISSEETLASAGSILRNDEKADAILCSLLSAYIFDAFPLDAVHGYFTGNNNSSYVHDFFEYLKIDYSENLNRKKGLSIFLINNELLRSYDTESAFEESVYAHVKSTYETLSNHCYYAILIECGEIYGKSPWALYSKVVLYAEKFLEEELDKGYFHPEKIEEQTRGYISELKSEECRFSLSNGGFTYKDCFVIQRGPENESSLLILFEKNQRDESLIPCPACRTLNVRGNSYPVLGVKSWECNNILCPDKSMYNRGKRYSLASLIKQEAINHEHNSIDNSTIRKWQLDVVKVGSRDEIIEFLIKHYSLYNDTIELTNLELTERNLYGRNLIFRSLQSYGILEDFSFFESAFFKRFKVRKKNQTTKLEFRNLSPIDDLEVYNGDSEKVLMTFHENSIDAAVTSPPYYNAKEYSQWPNIYTYLYDMYNNAIQVHRVLKEGGAYLYNIFDYFDNENNIVFSAMGKKRMILGAYIIELFKDVGFELVKNIAWNKGHVQGNRSFNQGNNFPYYQAPLNCYEHILYFRKSGNEIPKFDFPDIVDIKPFYKMVKGVNILGHTAPFPKEIPNLIISKLKRNSIVLDPYAGSFTTARACMNSKMKSINIEMSEDYTKLGLDLIKKEYQAKKSLLFQD